LCGKREKLGQKEDLFNRKENFMVVGIKWIILIILTLIGIWKSQYWLNVFSFFVYLPGVIFRMYEKVGNYHDWRKKNIRDEKNKVKEVDEDFSSRGLFNSGLRKKRVRETKEDFEFERRKRKRGLINEIYDAFFLK